MENITPEEQIIISNAWYRFLIDTIKLDKKTEGIPNGWHWFWGLYYLYNKPDKLVMSHIERIKETVPDEHWLKKIGDDELNEINNSSMSSNLIEPISNLLNKFKEIEIIATTPIDFSNLSFHEHINFSEFIFLTEVSFSKTNFLFNADFSMTTFYGSAFFNYAEFRKDVDFQNTKFFEIVEFSEAKFFESAYFNKVLFPELANFYKTTFFKAARFTGATFSQIAGFRNTKFSGNVDFSNTDFKGHTNFIGADFKERPPHFYNAKLSADITWRNATWPSMNSKTNLDLIDQNQNAYENLTYHMKTLEKYHDTHFFFRQEMRCRRKLGSVFNSLLYGFYEYFADYGYGVERALMAWVLHIVLGMVVIMSTVSYSEMGLQESLFCSASVSVANANPYVFLVINEGGLMACYEKLNWFLPMVFSAVRGFQTIAGIPLLFLVLLTLRIRFRLK